MPQCAMRQSIAAPYSSCPPAAWVVSQSARAGKRHFWLLSTLRAHTKALYRTDLLGKRWRLTTPEGPDWGPNVQVVDVAAVVAVRRAARVDVDQPRGVVRPHPPEDRGGIEVLDHVLFVDCAGRKPPFLAVKRPARPYKTAIQNRFT